MADDGRVLVIMADIHSQENVFMPSGDSHFMKMFFKLLDDSRDNMVWVNL